MPRLSHRTVADYIQRDVIFFTHLPKRLQKNINGLPVNQPSNENELHRSRTRAWLSSFPNGKVDPVLDHFDDLPPERRWQRLLCPLVCNQNKIGVTLTRK